LHDRSSRPRHSPRRTSEGVEQAILRAREELREGPHVIGWALGIAASTVHAVLRRHGCSRLFARARREEIVRYERSRAGELVHVDVKKLGRIVRPGHRVTGDRARRPGNAGWHYLFVAIDDHSRLGFAQTYPDETADSALAFLDELVRFYASHGIAVERVLTDNGTCFKRRWSDACAARALAVRKTRPYRPQTNGKAERFIRTPRALGVRLLLRARSGTPGGAAFSARLLQSLPSPPRSRRPHATAACQQPPWDVQLVGPSK
jgi:transposase InsO family protein